jgi:2-C-methyl-D-erythritol 4-phosphate cytidylyltransferase
VLIHDAARPFTDPNHIREVVAHSATTGAAILAVPVVSTLKQSRGETMVIEKTVPRAGLWEAQTPQCFSYELIARAHATARESGYTGTDDASLVERLGVPVSLVRGSSKNIKITTPEDLELARWIYEHTEPCQP